MSTITTGSEKQIAWATKIQQQRIESLTAAAERKQDLAAEITEIAEWVATITDAKVLIDGRSNFDVLFTLARKRGMLDTETHQRFFSTVAHARIH